MTKKIYFIIEEFNSSGGIKIVSSIANILSNDGYIVEIIVFKKLISSFYELNRSIIIRKGPTNKFKHIIYLFKKINNIDGLIVSTNFRLAVICYLVLLLKSKSDRLIFLIQGLDSISLINLTKSNFLHKLINKIFYVMSKNIVVKRIFVSNYLANKYNKKGVIIPNYVSELFFNHSRELFSKDRIYIGNVTTSALNKGFDFFLECCNQIKKDSDQIGQHIKFICATQDKNLREFNLSEEIEFISPKNEIEMRSFYSRCDVLLSCSVSEGFNLPVLEAMASGCIVISTDDGAVNDLITSGVNGYIETERNASHISLKLLKLLDDKNLMKNISREAKLTAKKYSKVAFDNSYKKYFKKS